jgi:hypothetical protein
MNAWWVIRDSYSGDYWSERDGWVTQSYGAQRFSNEEQERAHLPVGGYWIMMYRKEA